MTITSIANNPAASAAVQSARSELAGTLDTFLTLLTAQLQNQDPLSPIDSSQFTEQLVQFSQVEQQISTNQHLETLISQNLAASAALPLAYLGRSALISSASTALGEGPVRWVYDLAEAPAAVTLVIKDAAGRIVHTEDGVAAAGAHNFSWDGELANGERAPNGIYTLSVDARNAAGGLVQSSINVIETVSGIDFTAAAPRVLTASGLYDLSAVSGVYE
jgi:flagellar basal-body rod modification protein FlgD